MISSNADQASANSSSLAQELQAGGQIAVHDQFQQPSQLGARLKIIREQNGLSQRELAKRSSVTHSSISMIEQGQHSPSISSLEKILSGIPMTLAQFFVCNPLDSSQVVYRSSELAAQQQQSSGIIVQNIPHKSPQSNVVLQKIILSAGSAMGEIPRISNHAISALVIAGQLELTANMHVSLLDAGDAFSLALLQPYRLRNLSPTDECVVFVCEA